MSHWDIDSSGNELHLYQRGKEQHFYWTAKNVFLAFVLLGLYFVASKKSLFSRWSWLSKRNFQWKNITLIHLVNSKWRKKYNSNLWSKIILEWWYRNNELAQKWSNYKLYVSNDKTLLGILGRTVYRKSGERYVERSRFEFSNVAY